MAAEAELKIPVLTDAIQTRESEPANAESVDRALCADRETLIAELQTEIAASTFALTDEILRQAFAGMEASVFEQIASRLRRELPELIDSRLRERFGGVVDD